MITDLIVNYANTTVAWVLSALGALLSAWVVAHVRMTWAREALQRAWVEVQGAVTEISQIYVDELRKGRADGTLTDAEKVQAKTMAIEAAKANLGKKGLARLARVLGLDSVDRWLAAKTEQAVALQKGGKPLEVAAGPR